MNFKSSRNKWILIGLIMLSVSGIGITLASINKTVTVDSELKMQSVNITLKEYMITEDGEREFSLNSPLVPSQSVSMIPRVTNEGVDCYIRAKITFSNSLSIDDRSMSLDYIEGISDQWIYKDDGYLYYINILKEDESVDLYQGFFIPDFWGNEVVKAKYDIDLEVDAIQARNFTPDFETQNPWHDVEIIKSISNSK